MVFKMPFLFCKRMKCLQILEFGILAAEIKLSYFLYRPNYLFYFYSNAEIKSGLISANVLLSAVA